MPMKQEQEDASEEILEVAPGIRRLQLPIDFTGLGHVNCYALEDERGFALVDPGLPGPASWESLLGRLALAEIPLARVHSVVVTHSHPDHFGQAARLAEETGAEIIAHERFRTLFDRIDLDDRELERADPDIEPEVLLEAFLERVTEPRPSPWGGATLGPPPERLAEMRAQGVDGVRWLNVPRPAHRIADLGRVRLGGREWVGLDTPGHTDDHLCLYEPAAGTFVSGDHLLPTITPHISGLTTQRRPLGDFLTSLERMYEFDDVKVVLPAHGQHFDGLGRRAKEIVEHHDERMATITNAASLAPDNELTVPEYSKALFKPRSWGPMADSETFAHLEHLRLAGEAERVDAEDGSPQLRYLVSG
jgi:glyoxylase-like metal-dependent hydrolase (beta-lactamase superfamily II)